MKWRERLENWNTVSPRVSLRYLAMEWAPRDADRDAAWKLYIELLTYITTQPLPQEHGDEETALKSVYAMFGLTRDTIKRHGRPCQEFTKLAIVVLNLTVRPFTAKWHRLSLRGDFDEPGRCAAFRTELEELQVQLREYTRMLADMAGVEDLTDLEGLDTVERRELPE